MCCQQWCALCVLVDVMSLSHYTRYFAYSDCLPGDDCRWPWCSLPRRRSSSSLSTDCVVRLRLCRHGMLPLEWIGTRPSCDCSKLMCWSPGWLTTTTTTTVQVTTNTQRKRLASSWWQVCLRHRKRCHYMTLEEICSVFRLIVIKYLSLLLPRRNHQICSLGRRKTGNSFSTTT